MKKYIFTESQIKKVVDNVIAEQTDIQTTVAAVQCFLNQVMKANLMIDGKTGPGSQTDRALKKFQQQKGVNPDGVWGYNTQSTLAPQESKIWDACRSKYERA
jgi:peptidoglycan hydrolase-like protein with peptidoglycan-binding domain